MQRQIDLFLQHMLTERGSSSHTMAAYTSDLGQFMQFVERYNNGRSRKKITTWPDLTEKHLTAYLQYLSEEMDYAPSTSARKFAVLKSCLQFLKAQGTISIEPAGKIAPPVVQKAPPRTITPDEIASLLAEPAKSTTPKALRDKAVLELLYATGMRVTELINLDTTDFNQSKKLISCGINDKKRRDLELMPDVIDHLKRYLEQGRPMLGVERKEKALFLNHRGQRLTRQGLWLIIKGYVEEAGIEGSVTPHTLRHSFAAHLLQSGTNIKDLKEKLGHANASTTQVYLQEEAQQAELVIDGKPV